MTNSILHKAGGGRLSNLELLRLISMFMVLNLHSFWGFTHGTGILQALDVFRECASICAVTVFLIISGYFGIKWKFKSLFNLLFQLFFYAFAVYGVAVMIGVVDFSVSGLLRNVTCLYNYWAFITAYLLLYLCSPLLNVFVENVSNKQLLGFIIIVVISENLLTRNYAFLNFCTMYLIGRYIATTNIVGNSKIKGGSLYLITTFAIFILVYSTVKVLHITNAELIQNLPWGLSYAAPLVILQSIFLFVWFARFKFQSKVVNWCAASCLSIFVIHMHPVIKEIGYYGYTKSLYSLPTIEHIWKLAMLMIVVFFGSIFVDKIRIFLSSLIYKMLYWINPFKKKGDILSPYIPS